jgi:hypothetical protein
MAETHVVSGLRAKQEEIRRRISMLKREIAAHQSELEAIRKTLLIFEPRKNDGGNRLFRKGDLPRLIFDALRGNREGLDVDQLAGIVAEREGFDASDFAAVRKRCLMALYRQLDRGQVAKDRRGSARVWKIA